MSQLLELHTRKGIKSDGEVVKKYAIVDDEDLAELEQYTWYLKIDNANDPKRRHVSVGRHAAQGDKNHLDTSLVLLNRHIVGIDDPRITVRFKNGDPLDCRKENLVVTLDGNGMRLLRKHWLENIVPRVELPR